MFSWGDLGPPDSVRAHSVRRASQVAICFRGLVAAEGSGLGVIAITAERPGGVSEALGLRGVHLRDASVRGGRLPIPPGAPRSLSR